MARVKQEPEQRGTEEALERFQEPGVKRLSGAVYWVTLVLGIVGIFLAVNQTFRLNAFNTIIIDNSYYYLLIAIFLSLSFLLFPARKRDDANVPWYDWALFFITISTCTYLAYNGGQIIAKGWDTVAPLPATIAATILCAVALEGVRRAGGLILFFVCLLFFSFPLWTESDFLADHVGFLWGIGKSPVQLVRAYALGFESIVGVPMRVAGNILIGFLIFGCALVVTGGGAFFMNFAAALLGRSRGGPAKVAILSSGFFGSLSGSVISNVITTGQMTIPTMRRAGYSPVYAAGVEACASTGGTLMPPVMGAVAFLMAEFLNLPYSEIVIAAAVPSILFYLALLLQVDCHAAIHELKGLPSEEIPSLWSTLKEGWYFLFSLFLLIYLLVIVRLELYAPYFSTIALLICASLFRPNDRFNFSKLLELIVESTRTISNIVAILAGVGVIVGALAFTGVGGAFSRELVGLAQGSLTFVLVMGALTSFFLGMGVTVSACYIFLAIVMGPALIKFGLDPIASHLFILYWGMLSYITPPVALAAVAAAVIAKTGAIETGLMSMRLGSIKFILPFIVVLTPALILRGEVFDVVVTISACTVAIVFMAMGFEGYMYKVGKIGLLMRIAMVLISAGFLYPNQLSYLAALAFAIVVYSFALLRIRRRAEVH